MIKPVINLITLTCLEALSNRLSISFKNSAVINKGNTKTNRINH